MTVSIAGVGVERLQNGMLLTIVGDSRFVIVCPSRKREELLIKNVLLPFANVLVHASELASYQTKLAKAGVAPGSMLTHTVSGIGRIRNVMLSELFPPEAHWLVMMDDDLTVARNMWTRRSIVYREPAMMLAIIASAGQTAMSVPVGMFGFHQSGFPTDRNCLKPFYLRGWPPAHMCGVIDRELRYDTRFQSHDDIDFALQAVAKYGLLWRDDRFYFDGAGGAKTSAGGMAVSRSHAAHEQGVELLKEKWGADHIDYGGWQGSGMTVKVSLG